MALMLLPYLPFHDHMQLRRHVIPPGNPTPVLDEGLLGYLE